MFYDIRKVNYAKLLHKTQTEKPYAGSSNAWPIGSRDYSARHFRMREDKSFDCFYTNRTGLDEIEKGNKKIHQWGDNKFCTIHPDNTMSFENNTSHQSHNLILRSMLSDMVYHEKARGGTIIRDAKAHREQPLYMHPMFKGLKIDLESHMSVESYVVNVRKLDKKMSKEYLAPYQDFKKIAIVLVDPMSDEGIHEVLADLRKEFNKNLNEYINFKNLIDDRRYVDAGVWLGYRLNLNYLGWSSSALGDRFKQLLREAISTKTDKYLLSSTDIPFILEPLEGGKYFPTSKWGYCIVQNNQVKQRL